MAAGSNGHRPISALTDEQLVAERARLEAARKPGLVLRRADEIERKPLRWLWPGRFPLGKVSLLAGNPGLGKSIATLDIAARVTRGTPWPDEVDNTESGSVVLLSSEDDPTDTVVPRLVNAGADLERVRILEAVRAQDGEGRLHERPFDLGADLAALAAAVSELGDVRLVVIDPLSAYLGDGVDSNKNAQVRRLLAPLASLAARAGIAVIGVTHLNKSSALEVVYRVVESIAFTAQARAVWAICKDPEDQTGARRLFLPVKMNLSADVGGLTFTIPRAELPVIRWGEKVSTSAADALAEQNPEDRGERADARAWLLDYLKDGPQPAREVLRAGREAGHSDRTLKRVKAALGVRSEREIPGDRKSAWQWLPPQGATVPQGQPRDSGHPGTVEPGDVEAEAALGVAP